MTTEIVSCASCAKKNRVPAVANGTPRCGNCRSALPWLATARDDNFTDVVEAAAVPVLVDLWAPWCGPCRMVSPILESLARQDAGRLKLVKINVDDSPVTARRFDARSIPTLLVMNNGEVVARQVGALPEPALRRWLDSAYSAAGR